MTCATTDPDRPWPPFTAEEVNSPNLVPALVGAAITTALNLGGSLSGGFEGLSGCTYLNRLLESSRARCRCLAPVPSWSSFTAVRNSSGTGVT